MDVLRVMVNNSFKESFYKKIIIIINILTTFFISYKSDVKTFLKWIVNHCSKGLYAEVLYPFISHSKQFSLISRS